MCIEIDDCLPPRMEAPEVIWKRRGWEELLEGEDSCHAIVLDSWLGMARSKGKII